MITIDDDPDFWFAVAHHPEVWPHISLGRDLDVKAIVTNPRTVAFRAEHGGFLFIQLDGLGRVLELHTMFTPEGWGREVLLAAKEAFTAVFAWGAQVITTYEVKGNRRSQPPRTFRFEPAGGFAPAYDTTFRTWILTRAAWEGSPARRTMELTTCL